MKKSVRTSTSVAIFLLSLAFVPAPAGAGESQPEAGPVMSLRQCLDLAVNNSGSLTVSDLEVRIREFQRRSIRGHYLPLIRVDGKVIQFNDQSNLTVDLSFLGALTADFQFLLSDEVKAQLATYQEEGLRVKVRDDLVYEGGVTIAQPLTQLFTVYSGERGSQALVDMAQQDSVVARRKVESDVVRAYSGLVAATRMEVTLRAALEQLRSMETQVTGYVDAGIVEPNALLKVQVAMAEYEKNLFAAEKGASLATAALNMMMGRPLDEPFSPDPAGLNLEGLTEDGDTLLQDDQDQAVLERPELLSARFGSRAAKFGKWAAIGKMLPDINLIFRYHNTQGTGEMQPENEYFGGLVAQWDLWDWGVNYYNMRAAEAVEQRTEARIADGEDLVRLEVQSRRLELEEALKAIEVSNRQVALATENLRIVGMRYEAGEATTTEFLEARTLGTKAQNDLVIATVNLDAARYALAVARGVDLLK